MSVQTLLEPDWKRLKGTDGFENGLPEQEIGKKGGETCWNNYICRLLNLQTRELLQTGYVFCKLLTPVH